MGSRWEWSIAAGVVLWAASPLASAEPLLEQLRVCAAESDGAKRLACYDHDVTAALKSGDASSGATATKGATASSAAAATKSAEASFGAPAAAAPPPIQKLQAHITNLKEQPNGRLVFTLDNGQVWRQSESAPPVDIKNGEAVTITPGALGSFWLTGESRRSIRVKRAQ